MFGCDLRNVVWHAARAEWVFTTLCSQCAGSPSRLSNPGVAAERARARWRAPGHPCCLGTRRPLHGHSWWHIRIVTIFKAHISPRGQQTSTVTHRSRHGMGNVFSGFEFKIYTKNDADFQEAFKPVPPHRCADRMEDLVKVLLADWSQVGPAWTVMRACLASEPG